MKTFRHIIPGLRIHQGPDCLAALGAELDRVGSRRAVILTGTTLAKPGSPLDLVRDAMGDRLAGVYAGVRADTPLPHVEAAVRELRHWQADAIVAVGGGSAITTARAVNILLGETGHVRDLCTARDASGALHSPRLSGPKLPMLVVPTTPTTATVKAGSAVLDTEHGKRLALYDPKARAGAVFIHPAFVASAPRGLVVSAALNTLALTLEGLMSRRGDPLADAMLIHAARLLADHLPAAAVADDPDVRAELVAASILSGHGSDYTGAGMAIPIGHAISTRFDVDMGISDAILLPHVVRFNAPAAVAGLQKMVLALDVRVETPDRLPDAVAESLRTRFAVLGLPQRLRDVGVTHESLPELAAIAFDDWYLQSNPRRIESARQVQDLLEKAW